MIPYTSQCARCTSFRDDEDVDRSARTGKCVKCPVDVAGARALEKESGDGERKSADNQVKLERTRNPERTMAKARQVMWCCVRGVLACDR